MIKIEPYFSFIIPVKNINPYVRETVARLQIMSDVDWELFVITDRLSRSPWPQDYRIKFLESGPVGPAPKRDLAAQYSCGIFLVFLDDDSFPDLNFLKNLIQAFSLKGVVAVGGPGVTPPNNTIWQKASGATFETKWLSSDPHRYLPMGDKHYVDDWPTVNLSIKKDVFLEIGGFDSKYWPGEDTEFCLKLKNNGYKILYDPSIIVFHHRRSTLTRHLAQIGGYGLHRGFFARKFPQNSRKIRYFIPSFFCLYLLVLPFLSTTFVSLVAVTPLFLYLFGIAYYILNTTLRHNLLIGLVSLPYLILGHIWYGIRFIVGFLSKSELKSRLRSA